MTDRKSLLSSWRLRLAKRLLPGGYAIWTWGNVPEDELLDVPVIAKVKRGSDE